MWQILIADDHLVNRWLLKEILKGRAECSEAADGNEAILSYQLSLQEKKPFDVILMDIAMPKLNGVEVLDRIREQEAKAGNGQKVPIVAISAFPEIVGREKFNAFFEKPVHPRELIAKLDEILKK